MFEPELQHRSGHPPAAPVTVEYVTAATAGAAARDPEHLLAAIHFSRQDAPPAGFPDAIQVRAPALTGHDTEIWRSPKPLRCGCERGIAFRHSDEILFGWLRVAEDEAADLETATRDAYTRLYTFARESGFAHPLRIWNWFPAINRIDGGLERYRAFCRGRHRALTALETTRLPAASAIGTRNGGMLIYFLAARSPGIQVENPRQVSAFRYPRRYGPKSPSFSRAVVKHWDSGPHLYVSGTASIVGHESRHATTLAQLDESIHNLDTLIRRADDRYGLGIRSAAQLSRLKCYLRHAGEHAEVQQRLAERFGTRIPLLIIEGDICRADLRIEIEGIYTGAH